MSINSGFFFYFSLRSINYFFAFLHFAFRQIPKVSSENAQHFIILILHNAACCNDTICKIKNRFQCFLNEWRNYGNVSFVIAV